MDINGKQFETFYLDKNSRFVIIYGINVETGEEGFYQYDKNDDTVMRLDEETLNNLNSQITKLETKTNLYMYIIIGFLLVFIIMLIFYL